MTGSLLVKTTLLVYGHIKLTSAAKSLALLESMLQKGFATISAIFAKYKDYYKYMLRKENCENSDATDQGPGVLLTNELTQT